MLHALRSRKLHLGINTGRKRHMALHVQVENTRLGASLWVVVGVTAKDCTCPGREISTWEVMLATTSIMCPTSKNVEFPQTFSCHQKLVKYE